METDAKTKVLTLCKDFLGNAWSDVPFEDITFEEILTGYGNKTYHCSIKDCVHLKKYQDTEYKDVIVRINETEIFGKKEPLKFNGQFGEAMIIHVLSKMGIAPALLGVFDGGVIVEFIKSRGSNYKDWKDLEMCATFAKKLARLHTANVPISKKENFLEKILNLARSMEVSVEKVNSLPEQDRKLMEMIHSFPLEMEYEWIEASVKKVNSKLVLTHNDLNPNNILIKHEYKSIEDRIVFIDFEATSYFYRGYDIASFLYMKDLEIIRNGRKMSCITHRNENNARELIIQEYIDEFKRLKLNEIDEEVDTFEHLKMEVQFFDLVFRVMMNAVFRGMTFEGQMLMPMSMIAEFVCDYKWKKKQFIEIYGSKLRLV